MRFTNKGKARVDKVLPGGSGDFDPERVKGLVAAGILVPEAPGKKGKSKTQQVKTQPVPEPTTPPEDIEAAIELIKAESDPTVLQDLYKDTSEAEVKEAIAKRLGELRTPSVVG